MRPLRFQSRSGRKVLSFRRQPRKHLFTLIFEKDEPMSDTRFSGKRIYKHGSASQAVYDIRGKYIHRANSASQPEYEIRGNSIHRANSASMPEFDIRGTKIHKANSASQPIYEIR
jgi:hypothetical protein